MTTQDHDNLPAEKEVLALFDFLDAEPPYEAIGKVILAGADLETEMYNLLHLGGFEHKKAIHMVAKDRVQWLKANTEIDATVLDRIEPALTSRNLLAHGLWLNTPNFSAFVKLDKDLPDKLAGKKVDERTLKQWCEELRDLADHVRGAIIALKG